MKQLSKLIPSFWNHTDVASVSQGVYDFSFRKKWKLLVIFTSFMALLPLFVMTLVDLGLTKKTINEQIGTAQLNGVKASVFMLNLDENFQTLLPDQMLEKTQQVFMHDSSTDLFIIDNSKQLATPSRHFGSTGQTAETIADQITKNSGIFNITAPGEIPVMISYARIKNGPYYLVAARSMKSIKDVWLKPRLQLTWYLVASILIILISIMGLSTYLVSRIHLADRKRAQAIHHAEYANRLSSIGRLASGVAHEINNPLAIINEKIGLITDLIAMNDTIDSEGKLASLADDVQESVQRCSSITRRLQDFARHMEPSIEMVDVTDVISQVLKFLDQEAQEKAIIINYQIKDAPPEFECDKGSIQQIFLNLLHNAFTAMPDGGTLDIRVHYRKHKKMLEIIIKDSGIGIEQEDIAKIFEPFYTSQSGHWGTGLGLSITYNLIKELDGQISIKSKINEGTTVFLEFPVNNSKKVSVKS